MILGFNLLPAFPLDGGRVARALLWRRSGDRERATDRAASIGRAFGIGMIAFGVLAFAAGAPTGLWFALIGGFLIVAGGAESKQMHVERAFAGAPVEDLMSAPAVTVPASATLENAVTAGFAAHLFSAFPVVHEAGRAVGILALDEVRAVPATRRGTTRAGEVVSPQPGLLVGPQTLVTDLLRPEFHRVGRAVAVDAAGRPVGLISITDVQRRLRADALRPAGRVGPRLTTIAPLSTPGHHPHADREPQTTGRVRWGSERGGVGLGWAAEVLGLDALQWVQRARPMPARPPTRRNPAARHRDHDPLGGTP